MRVDAKVPGALKRDIQLAALIAVALGPSACRRHAAEPTHQVAALGEAVRPAFFAPALRKLGGAHYHATLRLAAGKSGSTSGASPTAVTTTTDVWVDRTGNYRLHEENDHDGGRDVVLAGRELAVALRYGKMIRRPAEEPEPTRLLEEGLGGPWSVFELAAPRAKVDKTGTDLVGGAQATVYALSLAEGTAAVPPARPFSGLRAWRGAVTIDALTGRAVVDDASGALLGMDLTVAFETKTEAGPEQGTVEVHALVSDMAATTPIERPAADELVLRQRTVPEARELLRGLVAAPEHRGGGPAGERHP